MKYGQKLKSHIIVLLIISFFSCILQFSIPLLSMQIYGRVLPTSNLATLLMLVVITSVLLLFQAVLEACRQSIVVRVASKTSDRLEAAWESSGLIALYGAHGEDADTLRSFFAGPAVGMVLDAPWAILFLLGMYVVHPQIGLIASLAVGISLAYGIRSDVIRQRNVKSATTIGAEQRHLREIADHYADGLCMGFLHELASDFLAERVNCDVSTYRNSERKSVAEAAGRYIRSILQIAILADAAVLVTHHQIDAGAIIACTMLYSRAVSSTERFCSVLPSIRLARSAWGRLRDATSKMPAAKLRIGPGDMTGRVELSAVSLRNGAGQLVIQPTSFTIRPGTLTNVAGMEGSGKTALLKIIAGLCPPSSGVVRYDGFAISDLDRTFIGPRVGYIGENPSLPNGRIFDIICRHGVADPDEVFDAAKLAGAHECLQRLPQGYNTVHDARSPFLPRSLLKRIAIARAFFRNPAIIIADDPTSGLTEFVNRVVLDSLIRAKHNGSTVIVSTREMYIKSEVDHVVRIEKSVVRVEALVNNVVPFLDRKEPSTQARSA